MKYSIFKIKKQKGKYRTIYAVDDTTKRILRENLPYLEQRLQSLDKTNANYAFTKGKNCVQHALQHVGYNYTLSMDLENFFDSVTPLHVKGLLDSIIVDQCFINGAPRQGLPTSPLVATIAFLKCDDLIVSALNDNNLDVVYTRYADDLVFSFNKKVDSENVFFITKKIVESYGFRINHNKTKLQDLKNGRIIITGIAIDEDGLYPTRKTKKKIRAAIHQANIDSMTGLLEWAKCKLPKNEEPDMASDRDYFEERGFYNPDFDCATEPEPRQSSYIRGKEINNPDAIKLATELVSIKTRLNELKDREKEIKNRLLLLIPLHSWIKLDGDWSVESHIYQAPKKFKRLEVLGFLKRTYDEQLASRVDNMCTNTGKKAPTIYVRNNKNEDASKERPTD